MVTQRQIIINYLRSANVWIPAYKLRSVNTPFGWLGHQADRVCRKLAEDGEIERQLIGRYAHYRTKQIKYIPYRVMGDSGIEKIIHLPS